MLCYNCGSTNDDNSSFCVHCSAPLTPNVPPVHQAAAPNINQQQPYQPYYQQPIYQPGFYVPEFEQTSAIIALVFSLLCTSGFGIVGIVFAIMALVKGGSVKALAMSGNTAYAISECEKANKYVKWAWIASLIGLAVYILIIIAYFVIMFAFVETTVSSYPYY